MLTFYSPHHRLHNTDQIFINNVPFDTDEIPSRAEIILEAIRSTKLGPVTSPTDHGINPIIAVHTQDYIEYLRTIFIEQSAFYGEKLPVIPETFATRPARNRTRCLFGRKGYYAFGVGTPILEGTWQAAYWSAQCALSGADHLLDGHHSAYALCRPPGHHAAADLYGGFCYLNNAAIAARYLGSKVAILDIDYHHGNGTQEIFYSDPSVLYCSLHADPDEDYPYFWGSAMEFGEGLGEGYNRNWPLPQKTSDKDYLNTLDEALETISRFTPNYLIVSLGFDIGDGDPVGGFSISIKGFSQISQNISVLNLPTLIVQEGGYLLDTLGQNAIAFLKHFT